MSIRNLLKQSFGLVLVVLILAGCGGAQAEPTATSTTNPPTSTPMPPTEPPSSPTPESASVTARVKTDLRGGPGSGYNIVGELNAGKAALVTGRNAESTWWQISFQGGTAWIRNSVATANSEALAAPVVGAPLTPTPRSVPRRRVVTGLDAQGKSTILLEDPLTMYTVWQLPPGPAKLADETDSVESVGKTVSGTGGMHVVRVVWPSGGGFGMHRTWTLDIVCFISGQVELRLENGSTVSGTGECVIQRDTQHAWRVVGDETFVLVAVYVNAAIPSWPTPVPATLLTPAPTGTASAPAAHGPGRRTVTGIDAQDKSTISMDGLVPDNAILRDPGKATEYAIWTLPLGPADVTDETDPLDSFSYAEDRYPPPGGVQARVIIWEPGV